MSELRAELPASLKRNPSLDQWVRIDPRETITVRTGKVEIGQGILTALTLIAAEELEVDPSRVRVETAVTGRSPNELITAGSMSVEDSGSALRQACAHARRIMLERAAVDLGVEAVRIARERRRDRRAGCEPHRELLGRAGRPRRSACRFRNGSPRRSPAEYRVVGKSMTASTYRRR